jgi:hypothetical protein
MSVGIENEGRLVVRMIAATATGGVLIFAACGYGREVKGAHRPAAMNEKTHVHSRHRRDCAGSAVS